MGPKLYKIMERYNTVAEQRHGNLSKQRRRKYLEDPELDIQSQTQRSSAEHNPRKKPQVKLDIHEAVPGKIETENVEVIHVDYSNEYNNGHNALSLKDTSEENAGRTTDEFNAENIVLLGKERKPKIKVTDEKILVVNTWAYKPQQDNNGMDDMSQSQANLAKVTKINVPSHAVNKDGVPSRSEKFTTPFSAHSFTQAYASLDEQQTLSLLGLTGENITVMEHNDATESTIGDDTIEEYFETIFHTQDNKVRPKQTKPKDIRKVRVPRKLTTSQNTKLTERVESKQSKKFEPVHRSENVRLVYKSEGFVPEY